MRVPWRVVLIWLCFVARLAFYSSMLPLWEGYDEWAHFSVIRTMATRGQLLVARDQPVPRDVAESLQLAPVPWEQRELPPPSLTQDAYWSLTPELRTQREASFRVMPAAWSSENGATSLTAYEALQPPLYYWLMTPVARSLRAASLAAQVLAIRWLSILIASLAIPLVFAIGRSVFRDDAVASGCAAVVAVMPGLAIDVARVGNECLGVALFTALIWLGLRRPGPYGGALALGIVLGLGLLTKAYFLTAIPAVLVLLLVWQTWRRAALSMLLAAAISGWWYVHNLVTTGTLSGLSEAVILRGAAPQSMLHSAAGLPWMKAIDSILFSHLYFGGWSSLMVRSWMYHVFYVIIAAAALGLLLKLRDSAIWWLIGIYGMFWVGQLYNVLLLFLSKGLPGSMGWYMYAVVAAEVVLCIAGLVKYRWAAFAGVILFALLDLYTVHAIAIPYYTGMIRHRANGTIASLHLVDFQVVGLQGALDRLAVYKAGLLTSSVLVALWLAYLVATIFPVFSTALYIGRKRALPKV